MRTVIVTEFGGPDVLRPHDGPPPRPGPGEVVVDVQVIEVLFLDTQLRAGWGRDYFAVRPPFVPGTGVGGRTADGRRVVARTGDAGAYAEQVVVPAEEVIDVPDGVDLAVALAALHDGVLALDRLERFPVAAGSRVLVTAAAGSLGHWLVPLAKAAGATVTGAAGGGEKVAAVRDLGADIAVDYRDDGWIDRAGGPFDVVFDGSGGPIGQAALGRTVPGGRFFAHGAASGQFVSTDRSDVEVLGVEQRIDDPDWRRLERAGLAAIADGRVRPAIGCRVPLERAAEAHAAIERRAVVGKTVLVV
jgi:NADPH:quinone reductase